MSYEIIDLEKWCRAADYKFFMETGSVNYMTVPLDFTVCKEYIKESGGQVFYHILYAVSRAVNDISAMRMANLRIEPDEPRKPVIFDRVDASFVVLNEDRHPINVLAPYRADAQEFMRAAVAAGKEAKTHKENAFALADNYFVVSYVPVSFSTVFMAQSRKVFDRPAVIIGKYYKENASYKLPVTLQCHHAFVDGMEMADFFNAVQKSFDSPQSFFGGIV